MKQIILILALMLFPFMAMAADESIRIIDPDEAAWSDYSSLVNWDAGEARNLVSDDSIAVAECMCSAGKADAAYVVSANWTTDIDRYVKIWTDPDSTYRHNGTYQSGNQYRIESSGACLTMNTSTTSLHTKIIGLQFKSTGTGINMVSHNGSIGSGWFYMEQCVVYGGFAGGDQNIFGIKAGKASQTAYVSNCMISNIINGPKTMTGISLGGDTYIYNCTVQNCYTGYEQTGGTVVARNCIAQDCTNDGFVGTYSSSMNNCSDISSDAPGISPQTGEVTFVDEVSSPPNLHLDNADTIATDNGTDLTSNGSYPISIDIDGDERTVSWCIGADENNSGEGAAISRGRVILFD